MGGQKALLKLRSSVPKAHKSGQSENFNYEDLNPAKGGKRYKVI